MPFLLAAL